MMEFTPGYYRHFKDAVAPITRGNPSGKGGNPLRRKPLLPLQWENAPRPASMWTEVVDKPEYHGPRFVAIDEKDVPEEYRLGQ